MGVCSKSSPSVAPTYTAPAPAARASGPFFSAASDYVAAPKADEGPAPQGSRYAGPVPGAVARRADEPLSRAARSSAATDPAAHPQSSPANAKAEARQFTPSWVWKGGMAKPKAATQAATQQPAATSTAAPSAQPASAPAPQRDAAPAPSAPPVPSNTQAYDGLNPAWGRTSANDN